MKPRLIQAFFNGACRTCGKKVAKGEQAWFAKHYGIRCQACGPHTDQDAPLPSRKGKKARTWARSPAPENSPRPAAPREPLRGNGFTPTYAPASLKGAAALGPDGTGRLMWSSVSELVEDAFADYAQSDDARTYLAALHRRHAGDRWANGHTPESLRKAVTDPSAELLAEIDAMRQVLLDEISLPSQPRRKVRRGLDWGDELDADRYLSREPNAWERSVRESQTRRTVTIGVNLTVACLQTAEDLIYRGAAAVALADVLTQRGVNVRVVGFSVGEDVSSAIYKLVSIVELKSADMPLDVASLATAVCDVGFFRMVVMPAEFRHLPGRVSQTLGTRGFQYLPGPDRMSLDYLVESTVTNREAAITWLREQMSAMSAEEVCHV